MSIYQKNYFLKTISENKMRKSDIRCQRLCENDQSFNKYRTCTSLKRLEMNLSLRKEVGYACVILKLYSF